MKAWFDMHKGMILLHSTVETLSVEVPGGWEQSNPATRNWARDHLISAQSTVRCSTNWAIAGMACADRLHLAFLQSFAAQESNIEKMGGGMI